MRVRRGGVALAIVVALGAIGAGLARPDVDGLSFVIRAANMHGILRRLADTDTGDVSERLIRLPLSRGSMRARRYDPAGRSRRTVLLTSGLHPAGIDEPRLVGLARELAASGLTVVTPDIPELSQFQIAPAITDDIEQAALDLLREEPTAPDGRIGLMGISFSGGLSVVAAGRPPLRGRVAYVFAFGGHDDLPRVVHYLCTGEEPSPGGGAPVERPPHDYGVAVILLEIADRVVPPDQVEPLRAAVRQYLFASGLDLVNKAEEDRQIAGLRDRARQLPEPSATLLREVTGRDVAHLGPRLLPFIGSYGTDPALSVSRSPKPDAPVFLLHGTEDNVIPAVESEYLARDLRGHAPVRLLLSGLISHAEADRPAHVGDVLELASFWGDLLHR